jgi:phosphatidylglycerophosphatase A
MEKLPGAWGVMADDLLGGIYAGILLCLALTLIVLFS